MVVEDAAGWWCRRRVGQGGAAGVGVAEPDFSRRVGEVARNDNLFGKRTEL